MDLLNEFIHQYTIASLTKRWVGSLLDFAIYLGLIFLIMAPFYGEATIGIIGLIVAANNPHKQRIGDRVAQTKVISTRKPQLLNVPKIL